ncbi:MAG: LysM peptidoglycan-binding domain-containing protein [Acidimicrobiales bacterium]|nr:LysM peptidoglycan-binding domain-containing protein [Acidimicrobiales bacterium]
MRSLATGAAVLAAAASYGVGVDAGAQTTADQAGSTTATSLYTVRPGDTLYSIAKRFGTTAAELTTRNALVNAGQIRAGSILIVPAVPDGGAPRFDTQAGTVAINYTVVSGDTLNSIARRFGTSAATLASSNGISNPNTIFVGQVISIPLGTRTGTPEDGPTLRPSDVGDPALSMPGGAPVPTAPTTPTPTPTQPNPTPVPSDPATPATLPRSLFGNAATDPARLALVPVFDRWADTYGVPRDLMKGMAFVESGWRKDALSSSGAVGIGQLMPDTSRWIASTLIGDPTLDPNDPEDNIRMMARYLQYLRANAASESHAIGAYYQGLGSVQRNGLQPVTLTYIQKVQAARAAFS